MPVIAPIAAAIGASVFAGTTLGVSIAGAIGGTLGTVVVASIGGAIGGAIGGGVTSVMSGGDFWDGAKGGAIGGAAGAAFSAAGGMSGIMDSLGLSGAEAATTAVTPAMSNVPVAPAGADTLAGMLSEAQPGLGASSSMSAGAGLGEMLSGGDIGMISGSAPSLVENLGSTGAMQASNQVGSQAMGLGSTLASQPQLNNITGLDVASATTGMWNKGQTNRKLQKEMNAQRASNAGFRDYSMGLLRDTVSDQNSTRAQIDQLFASYGIKR